jgi:hypothetical protein
MLKIIHFVLVRSQGPACLETWRSFVGVPTMTEENFRMLLPGYTTGHKLFPFVEALASRQGESLRLYLIH